MKYKEFSYGDFLMDPHQRFDLGDLIGSDITKICGMVVEIKENPRNQNNPIYKVLWLQEQIYIEGPYGAKFGIKKI